MHVSALHTRTHQVHILASKYAYAFSCLTHKP